jgi:hypothetical protein
LFWAYRPSHWYNRIEKQALEPMPKIQFS